MKHVFSFFLTLALLISFCSCTYALTLTENFEGYTLTDDLIGEGTTGGDWSADQKWSSIGMVADDWTCQTVNASNAGQFVSDMLPAHSGYRAFGHTINTNATCELQYIISGASPGFDLTYSGFSVSDNAESNGPVLFWKTDGADNLILKAATSGPDIFIYNFGNLTGKTIGIKIEDVDFDADTYNVLLDLDGGTEYAWNYHTEESAYVGFEADIANFSAFGIGGNPGNGATASLDNIVINGVPEPSTYALFGLGLFGLAYFRRKSLKK
ncbi:MAG: PEP-CTERM sorting domain-containing protein [Candidatus Ancaeobacter aquaticus]|nr:PEP-CTERM sorting domain-containing protein [Candidatus Ancaeobacter aquaticus]